MEGQNIRPEKLLGRVGRAGAGTAKNSVRWEAQTGGVRTGPRLDYCNSSGGDAQLPFGRNVLASSSGVLRAGESGAGRAREHVERPLWAGELPRKRNASSSRPAGRRFGLAAWSSVPRPRSSTNRRSASASWRGRRGLSGPLQPSCPFHFCLLTSAFSLTAQSASESPSARPAPTGAPP